jgi:hypothetical protein
VLRQVLEVTQPAFLWWTQVLLVQPRQALAELVLGAL